MNDEDALLAAVAAAPRDDAPRLVYADWLQDHNHDAKADYLRAVVTLLHDPDARHAVDRCTALSQELDAGWRQRVGGRFEVLLEGLGALSVLTHVFQAVLKLASQGQIGLLQPGQPVRLQAGLTREEAENLLQSFGMHHRGADDTDDPPFRVFVRAMEDESTVSLFGPPAGPGAD